MPTTTTKEGLKDVKWIVWGTTSTHSLLKGIFSILVIHISFLGVTQHLICMGNFLELQSSSHKDREFDGQSVTHSYI